MKVSDCDRYVGCAFKIGIEKGCFRIVFNDGFFNSRFNISSCPYVETFLRIVLIYVSAEILRPSFTSISSKFKLWEVRTVGFQMFYVRGHFELKRNVYDCFQVFFEKKIFVSIRKTSYFIQHKRNFFFLHNQC